MCDNATGHEVILEGTNFTMNYAKRADRSFQKSGDVGGALVVFEDFWGSEKAHCYSKSVCLLAMRPLTKVDWSLSHPPNLEHLKQLGTW